MSVAMPYASQLLEQSHSCVDERQQVVIGNALDHSAIEASQPLNSGPKALFLTNIIKGIQLQYLSYSEQTHTYSWHESVLLHIENIE